MCHIVHFSYASRRSIATSPALLKPAQPTTDEPVPYSKSKAYSYHGYDSFKPPPHQRPWYEPFSIIGSFTVFLIYFTCLREENDIDLALSGKSLFEQVPGLEEKHLRGYISYHVAQGKDISEAQARLKEIIAQKNK